MADISADTMKAWRALLPDDLKSVIPDDGGGDERRVADLCEALRGAPAAEWPGLVVQHAEAVREMGRARRIKFLAWVSNQTHRMNPRVFADIVSEDDQAGGRSQTGVLFVEDIRALNEALARRVARRMGDKNTFEMIREASREIENEPEFRREGM